MNTQSYFIAALLARGLHAQSTLGTILGTVRDSSGAAVPGAALTLRNLDENTSLSGRTEQSVFTNSSTSGRATTN